MLSADVFPQLASNKASCEVSPRHNEGKQWRLLWHKERVGLRYLWTLESVIEKVGWCCLVCFAKNPCSFDDDVYVCVVIAEGRAKTESRTIGRPTAAMLYEYYPGMELTVYSPYRSDARAACD